MLITVSQNADIYNNVLDGNFGGIEYFLNCGSFSEGFDLRNNAAHDNTITVTTAVSQAFGYANGFSHLSQCTANQLLPYVNGSKNLTFSHNTYHVPSLSLYPVLSLGRLEGLDYVAGAGSRSQGTMATAP